MNSIVENMRAPKEPFGDDISNLPIDEEYEENPQDLKLINSIFVPVDKGIFSLSKELRSVIFAVIVYFIVSSPIVNKHIKKCSSNKDIVNLIVFGSVAISTYMFYRYT
jgi:hypothetical protein